MLSVTSTPTHPKATPWLPAGVVLLTAAVFALDCLTPRGYAVWIFYLLPLMLTGRARARWYPLVVAALCTVLVLFGFFLAPLGIKLQVAILNRAVGVGVLWVTAALLAWRKQTEEVLLEKEHMLSESQRIARIGSWVYDLTGRITWSDEMYRIYGVSPETLVPNAESFLNLIYPEDRTAMQGWIADCLAGKRPGDLEFRRMLPDGTVHIISGRGELRYDSQNRPAYLAGTAQDITERKQVEQALQQSEERFSKAFHASPDAIGIATLKDGRYLVVNDSLVRLGGGSREDILKRNAFELGVWTDPEDRARLFRKLEQEGRLADEDVVFRTKSGELRTGILNVERIKLGGEECLLVIVRDDTEKKQAEMALRRLATLQDQSYDAVFAWYLDGPIVYWNHGAEVLYGIAPADAMGFDCRDLLHTVFPESLQHCKDALNRTGRWEGELNHQARDGRRMVVESRMTLVREADSALVLEANRDVTERKRAEEAIRVNEERLRLAQLAAEMGVFDLELPSRKQTWSPRVFEIFGLPAGTSQPSFEDALRFVHPEDRALVEEQAVPMFAGKPVHFDHRIVLPDGDVRWVEIYGKGGGDEAGQPVRYLGTCRDITERKRAEEELARSQAGLRALAGRLQGAIEDERTRIARELHDELGQLLTGLKMEMSGMAHKLRRDQSALHEPVAATLDLLDSCIFSVRKIATELRPGLLDALGLAAAIEWQVEEFQARTGVSCSLTLPREKLSLPDDQATALFRILQEALTNIARHAQAKHAEVRLAVASGRLVLEVLDDGRGIRPDDRAKARSLGIVGMRERALLLGGEVEVTGSPGSGTTVRASVPVEAPSTGGKA